MNDSVTGKPTTQAGVVMWSLYVQDKRCLELVFLLSWLIIINKKLISNSTNDPWSSQMTKTLGMQNLCVDNNKRLTQTTVV